MITELNNKESCLYLTFTVQSPSNNKLKKTFIKLLSLLNYAPKKMFVFNTKTLERSDPTSIEQTGCILNKQTAPLYLAACGYMDYNENKTIYLGIGIPSTAEDKIIISLNLNSLLTNKKQFVLQNKNEIEELLMNIIEYVEFHTFCSPIHIERTHLQNKLIFLNSLLPEHTLCISFEKTTKRLFFSPKSNHLIFSKSSTLIGDIFKK